MKKVEERFLEYVKFDTKSDTETGTTPSTEKQLVLAKHLVEELKSIGLKDVVLSEYGYVYATLESNSHKDLKTIGFIAHMDTAPDYSGTDVKPQIVKNYDGGDIKLNENTVLSPSFSPELKEYIGKTLITTDGTTLLGADDKAGIAEIVTAIEYLVNHPEIEHGTVKIGFTPDEEIGEGADHFDVESFGADFAYTLDGGTVGEIEYENFNAAGAKVVITGVNFHPAVAKNKMINSMMIANEFISMLPSEEVPEKTEKYEGFSHLIGMSGTVENTVMQFIIRDFFEDTFEAKKQNFKNIEEKLNEKYGKDVVKVEIKEQYRNMREKVEPVMYVVDMAKEAMEKAGVVPTVKPIRGGTDGARLSYMGLPTPNIFTGGENFHGKFEYIPIESMEKAVETVLNIIQLNTKI